VRQGEIRRGWGSSWVAQHQAELLGLCLEAMRRPWKGFGKRKDPVRLVFIER
jgi:hypothetical protein